MKTSTKLIIIFFSIIPVSLLAYNYVLKTEFDKRNFIREYMPDATQTYVGRRVAPFKHVVIDGVLRHVGSTDFMVWRPTITINKFDESSAARNHGNNNITVLKLYADRVHTVVKNDTLFVSFFTRLKFEEVDDSDGWREDMVRIPGVNILSIDSKYANVNIGNKALVTDSLKLTLQSGGKSDINNLTINKLNVMVSDSSAININKTNHIKNLHYSLLDKGSINLDQHPVQQFHAGKIDSGATIQLSDKAGYMQKQLH